MPLHPTRTRCVLWLFIALLAAPFAGAQEITVTPNDPDGVYDIGQPIEWRVQWQGESPPATLDYVLKHGGLKEVGKGIVSLQDGAGTLVSRLDAPGALLLEVSHTPNEGKPIRGFGGAIAAPEQIEPSAPRPDGFDAFWEGKIGELSEVPMNPRLEPGESGREDVAYWKITLDHFRGAHINGQLARPTQGEKFPAMLVVQWAGVYGLDKGWATGPAGNGWLVLNILPHELPIDEPKAFYEEQSKNALKNYPGIGNDDRETSYFLRMYLSCYRAAEYLTTRDDWDGQTLVVMGGSQGGMQALVTAALHPKVTAAMANVPAGCDMLGPDAGRSPGWPMWYWSVGDKDPAKVREASRYFDVVNFAPRIRCPVLVGIGLLDNVCPPAGIFAAVNQIEAPVEVVVMPTSDHGGKPTPHKAYNERAWGAWLPALKVGETPPVQPFERVPVAQ